MKNLMILKQTTMSSREIAELTGKEHKHVLRDCDVLNENYEKLALPKIGQGYFTHPNTGNQQHREYLLTKMQCFDLLTGYSAELRIKVNRRWEELEQMVRAGSFQIPQTMSEALRLAAIQAEQIEQQQKQLEENKPKVWFSDSFDATQTLIGIGDLAKLLCQKGVDIGQNRLFDWMVNNHYLMISGKRYSRAKDRYENDYMPTQRAADLDLFFVIPRPIPTCPGDPPIIKHTVKVTGKGVKYFMEKFLYNNSNF
jgi:phage antirepressor YoqD-like protein